MPFAATHLSTCHRPRRCWALSYLSDGPNEKIQAVIEAGVCTKLVKLLMHPSPLVQTPALRTVGNIVTGNETQTQTVIDAGAVPNLLELLSHSKKGIQKEACWAISNITAGNKDQIQSTIDANAIPPLVKLLRSAELDTNKGPTWAISNATSGGTPRQIKFLVSQDCIPPLCELLSAADEKLVTTALEALGNILQVGSADAGDLSSNKMAILIVKSEGPTRIRQVGSARAKAMVESYFQDWESWDLSGFMPFAALAGSRYLVSLHPPGASLHNDHGMWRMREEDQVFTTVGLPFLRLTTGRWCYEVTVCDGKILCPQIG